MKVLVTGANGFLGSWLTRHLLEHGHNVNVLVRKSSDLSALEGVNCNYLYGDVTDLESCQRSFSGIQTVFHLAGLVAYNPFERSKMSKVNVGGTNNVILACKRNNVSKLVHISSVCAIGAGFSEDQILDETSTFNLRHLRLGYFDTKRVAEKLVVRATRRGDFESVILNPSTIYGAGDAKKGSRGTQLKVAKGKFPFYTSGGANVVAVEDVVDGILAAWTRGKNGERYILCGENILIKDLFSRIASLAGVAAPKVFLPNPILMAMGVAGDLLVKFGQRAPINSETAWVARLYHWFSNAKARQELGFNPRPSQIALENSIKWCKDNRLI